MLLLFFCCFCNLSVSDHSASIYYRSVAVQIFTNQGYRNPEKIFCNQDNVKTSNEEVANGLITLGTIAYPYLNSKNKPLEYRNLIGGVTADTLGAGYPLKRLVPGGPAPVELNTETLFLPPSGFDFEEDGTTYTYPDTYLSSNNNLRDPLIFFNFRAPIENGTRQSFLFSFLANMIIEPPYDPGDLLVHYVLQYIELEGTWVRRDTPYFRICNNLGVCTYQHKSDELYTKKLVIGMDPKFQKGYICSNINGDIETGWNVGLLTRFITFDDQFISSSTSPSSSPSFSPSPSLSPGYCPPICLIYDCDYYVTFRKVQNSQGETVIVEIYGCSFSFIDTQFQGSYDCTNCILSTSRSPTSTQTPSLSFSPSPTFCQHECNYCTNAWPNACLGKCIWDTEEDFNEYLTINGVCIGENDPSPFTDTTDDYYIGCGPCTSFSNSPTPSYSPSAPPLPLPCNSLCQISTCPSNLDGTLRDDVCDGWCAFYDYEDNFLYQNGVCLDGSALQTPAPNGQFIDCRSCASTSPTASMSISLSSSPSSSISESRSGSITRSSSLSDSPSASFSSSNSKSSSISRSSTVSLSATSTPSPSINSPPAPSPTPAPYLQYNIYRMLIVRENVLATSSSTGYSVKELQDMLIYDEDWRKIYLTVPNRVPSTETSYFDNRFKQIHFFTEPTPVFVGHDSLVTNRGGVFSFEVKQVSLATNSPESGTNAVLIHSGCRSFTRLLTPGGHANRTDNIYANDTTKISPFLSFVNTSELQTVHFDNGNHLYISQDILCKVLDINGDGWKDVVTLRYDPLDENFLTPTVVIHNLYDEDGMLSLSDPLSVETDLKDFENSLTIVRGNGETLSVDSSDPWSSFEVTDIDGNGLPDFLILSSSSTNTIVAWMTEKIPGGGIEFFKKPLRAAGSYNNVPISMTACYGTASDSTPLKDLYVINSRNDVEVLYSIVEASDISDVSVDINTDLCSFLCPLATACVPHPYPRCVCSHPPIANRRIGNPFFLEQCLEKTEEEVIGVEIVNPPPQRICSGGETDSSIFCLNQSSTCMLPSSFYSDNFYVSGIIPRLLPHNSLTCFATPYHSQTFNLQEKNSSATESSCEFKILSEPMTLDLSYWNDPAEYEAGILQGFPSNLSITVNKLLEFGNSFFQELVSPELITNETLDTLLNSQVSVDSREPTRSLLCQSFFRGMLGDWSCPFPWVISQNILDQQSYEEPWCELPQTINLTCLGAEIMCEDSVDSDGYFSCTTTLLSPVSLKCPSVPAALLAATVHAIISKEAEFLNQDDAYLRNKVIGILDDTDVCATFLNFCQFRPISSSFFSTEKDIIDVHERGCMVPFEVQNQALNTNSDLTCSLKASTLQQAILQIECPLGIGTVTCWNSTLSPLCQVEGDGKRHSLKMCRSPLLMPSYSRWANTQGPIVQWNPFTNSFARVSILCQAIEVACSSMINAYTLNPETLSCKENSPPYLLVQNCSFLSWFNTTNGNLSTANTIISHLWECWLDEGQTEGASVSDCTYTCWSSTPSHAQKLEGITLEDANACKLFENSTQCTSPWGDTAFGNNDTITTFLDNNSVINVTLLDFSTCHWGIYNQQPPTYNPNLLITIDASVELSTNDVAAIEFSCGAPESKISCYHTPLTGIFHCEYGDYWNCILPLKETDVHPTPIISNICTDMRLYCSVSKEADLYRQTGILAALRNQNSSLIPISITNTFATRNSSKVVLISGEGWLCPSHEPYVCGANWCLTSPISSGLLPSSCSSTSVSFYVPPSNSTIRCQSPITGKVKEVSCTKIRTGTHEIADYYHCFYSDHEYGSSLFCEITISDVFSELSTMNEDPQQVSRCQSLRRSCLYQANAVKSSNMCDSWNSINYSSNALNIPGAYCSYLPNGDSSEDKVWIPVQSEDFWCEQIELVNNNVEASSVTISYNQSKDQWSLNFVCSYTDIICESVSSDPCSEVTCQTTCWNEPRGPLDCYSTNSVALFDKSTNTPGCAMNSLAQMLAYKTMQNAEICRSLFDSCQIFCAYENENNLPALIPSTDEFCNGKIQPREVFICSSQELVCSLTNSSVWQCQSAKESNNFDMDCLIHRKYLDNTQDICQTIANRCRFHILCLNGWRKDLSNHPFCTLAPLHQVGQTGGQCDCSLHWSPSQFTFDMLPVDLVDIQCYEVSHNDFMAGGVVPQIEDEGCTENEAQKKIINYSKNNHYGFLEGGSIATETLGISCKSRGYWSVEYFFLHILEPLYPLLEDRQRLLLHFLRNTDPFILSFPKAENVIYSLTKEWLTRNGSIFNFQNDQDIPGESLFQVEWVLPQTFEIDSFSDSTTVLHAWRRYWCLEAEGAPPDLSNGLISFINSLKKIKPVCSIRPGTYLPLCTVECRTGLEKIVQEGIHYCGLLSEDGTYDALSLCTLGASSPYKEERVTDMDACTSNLYNEQTQWPLPEFKSDFLNNYLQFKELCTEHPFCHGVVLYYEGLYFLRRQANYPIEILERSILIKEGRQHSLSQEQSYFLHPVPLDQAFKYQGTLLVNIEEVWQNIYTERSKFLPLRRSSGVIETYTLDRISGHKSCQEFVYEWSTPFLMRNRVRPHNIFNIPHLFSIPLKLLKKYVTFSWLDAHLRLVQSQLGLPLYQTAQLYSQYNLVKESIIQEYNLNVLNNSEPVDSVLWTQLYSFYYDLNNLWTKASTWTSVNVILRDIQQEIINVDRLSFLYVDFETLLRHLYSLKLHELEKQNDFRVRFEQKENEILFENNIVTLNSDLDIDDLELPCYMNEDPNRCSQIIFFSFDTEDCISDLSSQENTSEVLRNAFSCFYQTLSSEDQEVWKNLDRDSFDQSTRQSDQKKYRMGLTKLHLANSFLPGYHIFKNYIPVWDDHGINIEVNSDKITVDISNAGASEDKTKLVRLVPMRELPGFETRNDDSNPISGIQFSRMQDLIAYYSWILWEIILKKSYSGYNSLPVSTEYCSDRHFPLWRFEPNSKIQCKTPLCPLPLMNDIDWFELEFSHQTFRDQRDIPFYPNPPRESLPRNTLTGFPCSFQGYCDSSDDGTQQSAQAGTCKCFDDFLTFESMEPSKAFVKSDGSRRVFTSLQNDNCDIDTRGSCKIAQLEEVSRLCGGKGECVVDFDGGHQKAICECGQFPRTTQTIEEDFFDNDFRAEVLFNNGLIIQDKCSIFEPHEPKFCANDLKSSFQENGFKTPITRYPEQCVIPPSGCVFDSEAWQKQFQRNSKRSYSRQESFGCTLPRRNTRAVEGDGSCVLQEQDENGDFIHTCECFDGHYGPYCEHMTLEDRCYPNPSISKNGEVARSTQCIWNSHLHQFERITETSIPLNSQYDTDLYPSFNCGGLACSGNGECVHDGMDFTNSIRDILPSFEEFSYELKWNELVEFSPYFRSNLKQEYVINNTLFSQAINQYCKCREGFSGAYCEKRICTNPQCNMELGEWCKNIEQLDANLVCHCPIDIKGNGDCWRENEAQTCACETRSATIRYCNEDPNAKLEIENPGVVDSPVYVSCQCKPGFLKSYYNNSCVPIL